MSQARKPVEKKSKAATRRPLDDYETPSEVTAALLPFLKLGNAPAILEPAAGTGRMVRALKAGIPGVKVTTADIKRGNDFLKRADKPFAGHVITNPPYRDGLAEAFARKALTIADGKVAMLLQSGFVWGSRRADGFYLNGLKPELIVVIPWRIMFIDGDGNEIEGQFFSHCWVVWPERARRAGNKLTSVEWAPAPVL
jgi:hypothetical protein